MTGGVALLKEILDSCTESERKIAEYLIDNPKTAVFCTIAELARQADTNPPAVIRLCKRANLSGYRELQILLTKDMYTNVEAGVDEPPPTFELDSNQSVDVIAKTIISRTNDATERVLSLLNPEDIERATQMILTSRHVAIFGIGASSNVANDMYQKLSRIGIPCSFSFDSDVQIASACSLSALDTALIISYSGKSTPIAIIAEEAGATGAKIIGITSVGSNIVSKNSDVLLTIPATEPMLRTSASISRVTQLIMVDILYTTIVCRSVGQSIPKLERSVRAVRSKYFKSEN